MNAFMGQPTLVLSASSVTPSDTAIIPVTKGLYVGGFGDLSVILEESTTSVTFVGVDGFLPLKVKAVLDTNTTATNILALY